MENITQIELNFLSCQRPKARNEILLNLSTGQQQPQPTPQQQSGLQQSLNTSTVSSSSLQHPSLQQQQQHNDIQQQRLQQQQASLPSHHLLQHKQQQQQQQHVSSFFQNVQNAPSSTSFIQHSNRLIDPQTNMPTSQHIAPSAQKQPVIHSQQQQQQQQQIFSQQYRYPDFLSYGPPPAIPHPPMQQQGFNFVLANNQQQQYMQTSSAPTAHQANSLMPGCEDFGPVTLPPSHSMGPEQVHQSQTLLSQAFMYPPENQAFYYFHPSN